MDRMRRGLGTVALVAAVVGCGSGLSPVAPSDRPDGAGEATSGSELDGVTVRFGGTVAVGGVEVTYLALEGDSRCPAGVVCFWEGDAAVRIGIDAGTTRAEGTVHTTLSPRSLTVAEVEVILIDVLPRPVEGMAVDPSETAIVVRVQSAGS